MRGVCVSGSSLVFSQVIIDPVMYRQAGGLGE